MALAERLGVIKHVVPVFKGDTTEAPTHFRVKAARLRSVASYGFIFKATDNPDWNIGDDVAGYYGITKWEPPLPEEKDADEGHSAFHRYTDIQLWANYPDEFTPDEEVVITEKIHGRNCRIGFVMTEESSHSFTMRIMAGSFSLPRRYETDGVVSQYWKPVDMRMRSLFYKLHEDANNRNIVVFGEIYGPGLQDTTYGLSKQGAVGFRLIDIAVDQVYLDYDPKAALCEQFGIEMVPLLYRGPYSPNVIQELTDGPTTLCTPDKLGKFKGREGIVITPVIERLATNFERLILKSVSVDFLSRSGATDAH